MLKFSRVVAVSILVACSFSLSGTTAFAAYATLPDPTKAGSVERLYRLDCGHSLANDESVWTPGKNVGRSIEFSSTCWLMKRGSEWVLWDTGVPEATLNDPKGWSTLPKLIVYHLDKTITSQLAELGLRPSDVTYVALSHTHGDHIGNVNLFPDSTILIQRMEYAWISSPDGANDNVNQLKALARKLMGRPKHLKLLDGDTDLFGDGSVALISTPGHTPGHQSMMVHLNNSGFIILSADIAHSEENFDEDIVPSLNTDKAASIASMDRIKRLMAIYEARLLINHDKAHSDMLKLLPAFYD
jgi:N-acyl homoserine lactone hydrolase